MVQQPTTQQPNNVRATSSVAYPRARMATPMQVVQNIKFFCLSCDMPLSIEFLCTHKDGSELHAVDDELCGCDQVDIGMRVKEVFA